jgi:hypothetical protein
MPRLGGADAFHSGPLVPSFPLPGSAPGAPLEREPKQSILRDLDLTVIGRSFPEHEREIGHRLAR